MGELSEKGQKMSSCQKGQKILVQIWDNQFFPVFILVGDDPQGTVSIALSFILPMVCIRVNKKNGLV